MNRKVSIVILQLCFVLLTAQLYAKEPPPPSPNMVPQPGLPIDGGLLYLLVSGAMYGVYTLKKKR